MGARGPEPSKLPPQGLTVGALARRDALAGAWLERTLLTYPEQTAVFLRQERDPFRNPVGHLLAQAIPALLDQLLGAMDPAAVTTVLQPVIQVRAVQDLAPREAVGFLFLLKPILREHTQQAGGPDLALLDARIDEAALLAFDLYMGCRERVHEVRNGERQRRVAMQAAAGLGDGGRRT